jgi:DNA-binding beta-propeller fold protein YncE
MKNLIRNIVYFILMIILLLPAELSAQSSGYRILGTIDIGGEGWWDYLSIEQSSSRLFISHSDKVIIVDLNTNSVVGEIEGLHGVHGTAFVPDLNKGFITSSKDSSVVVFALKTLKVITRIKLKEKNPDAILFDPFSKRIFSFNNHSASATAIDPNTDKIIGTVKLDGDPEEAVSDLNGKVYVNLEDKSAINVFDPLTLKVINNWPVGPCESPSGIAMDIKNKRLFTVGRNNLMAVLDAESGKVITTLPIGGHVDGCKFDQATRLAFSSNGEGTVTVVKEESPNEFKVLENIPTQKGARTIALDEKTHRIYLSAKIEQKDKTTSFGVIILGRK